MVLGLRFSDFRVLGLGLGFGKELEEKVECHLHRQMRQYITDLLS